MKYLKTQEEIGKIFEEARTSKGWSQAIVSRKTGMAILTVSNIERGVHSPHPGNLSKLCKLFQFNIKDFYEGDVRDSNVALIQILQEKIDDQNDFRHAIKILIFNVEFYLLGLHKGTATLINEKNTILKVSLSKNERILKDLLEGEWNYLPFEVLTF